MSKTDAHETALLALEFTNAAAANIGDAGGLQPSAAAGNLYLALHTATPGEGGAGAECTYPNYARVAVPRSGAGFTVSTGQVVNAAQVNFPQAGSGMVGSQTATYFGVWDSASGGTCRRYGAITDPPGGYVITANSQPYFPAGSMVVTED